MKQIYNPYLPLWEYIPDAEPHVFDGRVYLYGSHDRSGGTKYCMNDYVCWSADVQNLKEWRYEGVIYRSCQDPRMPDVILGKDGRYYLYYCPDGDGEAIGVAVCGRPAGRYEFYGIVQDRNGQWIGKRDGDTWQFDPGAFRDEDGSIYLYSRNGPKTEQDIGKKPKNSCVMQLCDDQVTIREESRHLLPILGEAEGSGFEGHEFFEASSVRKIPAGGDDFPGPEWRGARGTGNLSGRHSMYSAWKNGTGDSQTGQQFSAICDAGRP